MRHFSAPIKIRFRGDGPARGAKEYAGPDRRKPNPRTGEAMQEMIHRTIARILVEAADQLVTDPRIPSALESKEVRGRHSPYENAFRKIVSALAYAEIIQWILNKPKSTDGV